jgi:hypothetical protein
MAESKRIILVITNSRGVSQAIVTDDFRHLLLDEAIRLVRRGVLIGVHIVEANGRAYLRSNANSSTEDNIDNLSVPAGSLSQQVKDPDDQERVSAYAAAYGKFLEMKFERDELLYLGGVARLPKKDVIKRLRPLAKEIKAAAEKYNVDVNLLAGILIDELARMGPDDLLDILGKLDVVDTSIGIAQVKMSTARDLIKKKYYSADPNISQSRLYDLLTDDKTSIQFAAAYLSFIKKFRAEKKLGTSAAEVASCYSHGLRAKVHKRGKQVTSKLRRFAREILD